jgi:hypothetical protein
MLDQGIIVANGTYDELKDNNELFSKFVGQYLQNEENNNNNKEEEDNSIGFRRIGEEKAPEASSPALQREFTPEKITNSTLPANGVFVFGSNDRGVHGLGAAKDAVTMFGAVKGQPFGSQGRSFAIRTKMYQDNVLTKYNELTEDNKKIMVIKYFYLL